MSKKTIYHNITPEAIQAMREILEPFVKATDGEDATIESVFNSGGGILVRKHEGERYYAVVVDDSESQ